MRTVTCRVTVYFDDPFWAMLYERESGGWYEANRTVFGAEPKDYEVYAFLLQNWKQLRFSPPVQAGMRARRPDNPKHRQRAASRKRPDQCKRCGFRRDSHRSQHRRNPSSDLCKPTRRTQHPDHRHEQNKRRKNAFCR